MFTCLWLDGLVGRDDKHHGINAARAGEHIFDKFFVPGDVYKSDADLCRKLQVREPEIDGNTAPLLFLEAVRVNAGQGSYQGRFAMVDVACSSDDYAFH